MRARRRSTTSEREPALELADQPIEGLERPQILARFLADRGRLESVGSTEHEASKVEQSGERRLSLAEELERRQRVAVPEPHRLLLGALARLDGAASEPALDPVDARSGEARIGRAEETVQLTPPAALPGKPEQRQQGAPELGLVESDLPLDRVGHAEGAERGLERCPIPLDAGADEGNLLRARVRADQRQQLLGDALERPTAAGAFEEAKRAVDFRGFGARCRGEQPSLEVREGRWAHIGSRRQLLDPRPRELRQVGRRALERSEGGAARLVGKRDRHVGPAGERLEQRPLRAGQVLEAVSEDGPPLPGRQLAANPFGGRAALEVAVPEAQPVELGPVLAVEPGEISLELGRLDEPRLELAQCRRQRFGETGETRRASPPVQPRMRKCPADDQRPLRVGCDGSMLSPVPGEPTKQVVERADLTPQQRPTGGEELALDPIDVRPVRHDQEGFARDCVPITLEQKGYFARVRGSGQQGQGHRPILVPPPDGISYRFALRAESLWPLYAATDLGRRPRLAAA